VIHKLMFALAALSVIAFARAAEPDGKFEDLGVQITSMTLQGTTFARDPSGTRSKAR